MTVQQEEPSAPVALAEVPLPLPVAVVPEPPKLPLFDRELSWIEFNRRVLGEAESPDVPLLERVKFLSICSNNLDEFFMIRVGEVRDLLAAKVPDAGPVRQQNQKLDDIRKRARKLLDSIYACLSNELLPRLKKEGISIERVADLNKKDRAAVDE